MKRAAFKREFTEYGQPDPFDDPIGHHLWWESNKCRICNGTGSYWPQSDIESEMRLAKTAKCSCCRGSGLSPYHHPVFGHDA